LVAHADIYLLLIPGLSLHGACPTAEGLVLDDATTELEAVLRWTTNASDPAETYVPVYGSAERSTLLFSCPLHLLDDPATFVQKGLAFVA
jgi:hypothetical protein